MKPVPSAPPVAEKPPSTASARKDGSKRLVGPRAFKLLWDAHSISGIVIGLGLFVIFYAGAFSLYRAELYAWADPAMRSGATMLTVDEAAAPLFEEAPPGPGADVIVSYPIRDRTVYWFRYQTAEQDTVEAYVNASTGETLPTQGRSALSDMLYELHFFGQGGIWGEVVSGFVSVFMLFAIASGLLIHLRKLPKDWHTFRPRAKLRDALADAHTVLGLVGLPFAAMYAISGAFLALLVILLGPSVLLVFEGDPEKIDATLAGFEVPPHDPTGEPAVMLPFAAYEDALPSSWDGVATIATVVVHEWGDAAAIATVYAESPGTLTGSPRAVLSAATGEVLVANDPPTATALGGTTATLTNLHFASFGGGLVKVLYFVLALATSAVILTGNVLWVLVRRPKDPRATPWLHRFLTRLTVGVGCGLVVAVPMLFLTTQVLPIDAPDLRMWEHVALFGTWILLTFAAFAGPTATAAARWQLALAGVLSLLVPLASGALGESWPWTSLAQGWTGLLIVDAGFALMGVVLVWMAVKMHSDEDRLQREGQTRKAVANIA
ncbi:MAG: PepSY-associated TM helix domain-containing protein [Bacteroidota bacterium]